MADVRVVHHLRRSRHGSWGPVRQYVRPSGTPAAIKHREEKQAAREKQMEEDYEALYESDPIMTVRAVGVGFGEDDIAYVHRGEILGEMQTEVMGGDGEVERVASELAEKTGYKHTDAWRGYYQTPDETGDLVKVLDTWVSPMGHTGDWQTQHQVPLEELAGRGGEWSRTPPPVPVFIAYTPTSNLFSVGMDMYVHKKDAARFKQYLRERNVSNEDIR
jgi:hypothetical protein